MDEQHPKQMSFWLTIDVTLIVVVLIVVSLGAWLGFMDLPPLNLLAKGPS